MLTALLIIGTIGLVIALFSAIFGEFDWLPEPEFVPEGALGTAAIAATFAGFGFGGAAAIGFGAEATWLVILIASLAGIVAWLIAFLLYRQLVNRQEPEGAGSVEQLVGTVGAVLTAPARVGDLGEVSLSFRGQPHKMNFLCNEEVRAGQQVVVTSVLSTSQVLVEPKRHEAIAD